MYVRNYMCTHIISILHNALYIIIRMLHYYYRINIYAVTSALYITYIGKKYTLHKTLYNYARFTILHACTQGTCIFGAQMEQFMYNHFQCCKLYVDIIGCMFCTCVHDIMYQGCMWRVACLHQDTCAHRAMHAS